VVGHDLAVTHNLEKVDDTGINSGDNVRIMGMKHASGAPGGELNAVACTGGPCSRDGKLEACMEGPILEVCMDGRTDAMDCLLSTPLHALQHVLSAEELGTSSVRVGDGDSNLRRWKRQARGAIVHGCPSGNQSSAGPKKRPAARTSKGYSGGGKRQRNETPRSDDVAPQLAAAGDQPRQSP
jgi:hypothetical protein